MSDTSSEIEEPTCYPTERSYIVNAITGTPTHFLVRSKDERWFWKVIDVSLSSYDPSTGDGKTFFFPSPEAYETAKNLKLSEEKKRAWRSRRAGLKCSCLSAHVCAAPKISNAQITV
jgi:hypothetical protein